jgi:glycosyltransferase involved in cell wall biosynthesis
MGKKSKNINKLNKQSEPKSSFNDEFPFVSVCTPTFNRRPFIPATIKCFNNQTYPKDRLEWIIVDDGSDKIEDLVKDIPEVKYFKFDTKMTLGKKRNFMHQKARGDVIVYMDDDDYYPPNRVSHAVDKLKANPRVLCAGSSQMYIWFNNLNQMWQFGPYGDNHATAGTFAFRKELLNDTAYNNSASLAEEREFLKGYTTPLVQLDSEKVILCFSHSHNTFDKQTLLKDANPNYVKRVNFKVEDFIKEPDLVDFYTKELPELLKNYKEGLPEMKPDVLNQMKELEFRKQVEIEKIKTIHDREQRSANITLTVQDPGQPPQQVTLSNEQVVELIKNQIREIESLTSQLRDLNTRLNQKEEFIMLLRKKINDKENIIKQMNSKSLSVLSSNTNIQDTIEINIMNKDEMISSEELLLSQINE